MPPLQPDTVPPYNVLYRDIFLLLAPFQSVSLTHACTLINRHVHTPVSVTHHCGVMGVKKAEV